jgi:hypothetical protein
MVSIPGHLSFLEQQLFSSSMQTFQPSFTHLCNVNYPDNLIQSIADAGRLLDVPQLTNIRAVVALDVEMVLRHISVFNCTFFFNFCLNSRFDIPDLRFLQEQQSSQACATENHTVRFTAALSCQVVGGKRQRDRQ